MKKSFFVLLAALLLGAGCGTTQEPVSIEQDGAGSYIPYEEAELARAESGDVVIFFHASWCPTCRALEEGIVRDADQIPEDLTILKADYDSEIDLRQKYGVTVQHTLVQVDSEGNEITRWNGGNSVESIVQQLK